MGNTRIRDAPNRKVWGKKERPTVAGIGVVVERHTEPRSTYGRREGRPIHSSGWSWAVMMLMKQDFHGPVVHQPYTTETRLRRLDMLSYVYKIIIFHNPSWYSNIPYGISQWWPITQVFQHDLGVIVLEWHGCISAECFWLDFQRLVLVL